MSTLQTGVTATVPADNALRELLDVAATELESHDRMGYGWERKLATKLRAGIAALELAQQASVPDGKVLVDKDSLHQVLTALVGVPHLMIRELQDTLNPFLFPDNPINVLIRNLIDSEQPNPVPGYEHRIVGLGQTAEATDVEEELRCDYCQAPTSDPWHGSGVLKGVEQRHIHACDSCRALLPGILVLQRPGVRTQVIHLYSINKDKIGHKRARALASEYYSEVMRVGPKAGDAGVDRILESEPGLVQ